MFKKTLQMILKKRFMKLIDHCLKERIKTGLMKDELGGEIIIELVTFRSKTYSYLSDNNTVNKKAKGIKSV